jgi:Zn-finger nucleic acid-binding protein
MSHPKQCPKCQAELVPVRTSEGEVDRCRQCKGLWFDNMEHEDLKEFAEQIDIGHTSTGAKYNAIDRIACPVCPNSPMIRMVDPIQPHIWFESCPVCYGRFYDAGEYRDFSELTLSEIFRRAPTRARP